MQKLVSLVAASAFGWVGCLTSEGSEPSSPGGESCPETGCAARIDTPIGGSPPVSIASGDLDGDGRDDLLVGHLARADGEDLLVLRGRGDGSFEVTAGAGIGAAPRALAIADFDGASGPDVAAVYTYADQLGQTRVYLNDGRGALSRESELALPEAPRGLAAADLDGDGEIDLAVVGHEEGLPPGVQLFLYFGEGDGTFTRARPQKVGVALVVVAADVDGDLAPDLVLASGDRLQVLRNDGGGRLTRSSSRAAAGIGAMAAGDLNGDGRSDLVTVHRGSAEVRVLLGTASGELSLADAAPTGLAPSGVALADLNGDGDLDVLVTNRGEDTVSLFAGEGTGALGARTDRAVERAPSGVAAGDFDGDGIADAATASAEVSTITGLIRPLP